MRRRDFISLVGGSAVWPLAARAQQPKLPRIGILIPANREPFWNEFQQGLREHDYIEGQTIQFEFRSAEGSPILLRGLADELVRLKVDIIVASQTPAVTAARQATTEIPIVMAPAGDRVEQHLCEAAIGAEHVGSLRTEQPHELVLVPSACVATAWTNVHDPTIWSFRDFGWATPLPGIANPNAVIIDRL